MSNDKDDIIVCGLSENTSVRDLKYAFCEYGQIARIIVISENG